MRYIFKNILFISFLLTLSLHGVGLNALNIVNIPFTTSDGLILIDAELEGRPGVFIFDTGTESIILNSQVRSAEEQEFHTVDGIVTMGKMEIRSLWVGGVQLENIEAYSRDLSHFSSIPNNSLLGLIGANIFESEVIHIDHDKNVIRVIQSKDYRPNKSYKTITTSLNEVEDVITMPVKIDGNTYNFIIDTGSTTSFIDSSVKESLAHVLDDKGKKVRILSSHDVSFKNVYSFDFIHLGKLKVLNMEMVETDMSDLINTMETEIHGIISLNQLPVKETVLDFANKKISFSL